LKNARSRILTVLWLLLVLLVATGCHDQIFSDAPVDLQEASLVGTWEAHYDDPGASVDRLILRADGTFQQLYSTQTGYTYQTPWNRWSIMRPQGGGIHIHLQGARFFDEGIAVAEKDGIGCPASQSGCGVTDTPYPFIDPASEESVFMIGELVLAVRSSAGAPEGLVLKHMRLGVDDVFSGEFYRVEDER